MDTATIMDSINRDARRPLRGYLRTNWSKDPYSFGSYSHVPRGASQSDRHALREPIGSKIFFAGEAVHPDYNSSVHAAYESGLMAADALLDTHAGRVGIVGAGISGLAAAHRLTQAGREVVVLEARERIGGRLWSDDTLGTPLDLGASWIHGVDGNPLTRLANGLGLVRVTTDGSHVVRGRGGKEPEYEGVRSWLRSELSFFEANVQTSAATELSNLNPWTYLFQQNYTGDEVIFPGGYEQILAAFEGDYDVRLGYRVRHVNASGEGVEVTGAKAERPESFDALLVTLPLGVLKRDVVTFEPPLPEAKRGAIERLGMGTLDKLYLLFDEPFWDLDPTIIATQETEHFVIWMNLYKYIGAPVLLAFHGGSAATSASELSDEQMLRRALDVLESAYPPSTHQ